MTDVDRFVDEIFRDYGQYSDNFEEDQMLPSKESLLDVCHILLNASCLPEEGRYSTFRVCFIPPGSEYLDSYIYSHVCLFSEPIELSTGKLHKLSPALNAEVSCLMLDVSKKPYSMIGILSAYTALFENLMSFGSKGTRMPRIPNIMVNKPGKLEFCCGETPLVCYSAGEVTHFRTNTFTSTLVADQLRKGSSVRETDRLLFLYKIMSLIHSYEHGGHVFVVPNDTSLPDIVDVKYKLPTLFFGENKGDFSSIESARKKDISVYADLIARLSCVDGGVVINKNLDLIGFGAQAIVDLTNIAPPKMRFVTSDDQVDTGKRFNDNGMRHRACYRFCELVDDSVAVIFSQDGSIKACTKAEGEVVVYQDVAVPMI